MSFYYNPDPTPIVVPGNEPPEVVNPPPLVPDSQHVSKVAAERAQQTALASQRRVYIMWIFALTLLVVAAAVGGGVGGSLAVQDARLVHSALTYTGERFVAQGQKPN